MADETWRPHSTKLQSVGVCKEELKSVNVLDTMHLPDRQDGWRGRMKIHRTFRRKLQTPKGLKGIKSEDLQPFRTTYIQYEDGSVQTIHDDWKDKKCRKRDLGRRWRGLTVFYRMAKQTTEADRLEALEQGEPVLTIPSGYSTYTTYGDFGQQRFVARPIDGASAETGPVDEWVHYRSTMCLTTMTMLETLVNYAGMTYDEKTKLIPQLSLEEKEKWHQDKGISYPILDADRQILTTFFFLPGIDVKSLVRKRDGDRWGSERIASAVKELKTRSHEDSMSSSAEKELVAMVEDAEQVDALGTNRTNVDAVEGSYTAKRGFTVNIKVWIGGQPIRAICDTGSGRDLIDKKFAAALRRDVRTKAFCDKRLKVTNPFTCGTVCANKRTPPIEYTQVVYGDLREPVDRKGRSKTVTEVFELEEMEGITAGIIIGAPTLIRMGMVPGEDTVEFKKLGVVVPMISDREEVAASIHKELINQMRPRVMSRDFYEIEGPAVVEIPVTVTGPVSSL